MISRHGGEDQGELPFPPGSCMAELFDASAPPVSTVKASGGDCRGLNSGKARGHLRTPQESQESGNTAGSIGRLPFLTLQSSPSVTLNAGAALAFAPTAQSMSFPRACSVCCCWRGSNCRSPLTRRCALVDKRLWTLWGATESHIPALADSRSGRPAIERMQARVCPVSGRWSTRAIQCVLVGHERGRQLAIDVTLRCALSSSGELHPSAADVGGAVLARVWVDKEATQPELLKGRCRLVVLAIQAPLVEQRSR